MAWQDKNSYLYEQADVTKGSEKTKEHWLEEAITCYRSKRYKETIKACEQAIQLDANYDLAYYGMGLAFFDLNLYFKALKAFEKTIQLSPNDPKAYIGKGNTQHKLHRYEEALATYEQALQLDLHNRNAHIGRGRVLYALKRYEEARAEYYAAGSTRPIHYVAW